MYTYDMYVYGGFVCTCMYVERVNTVYACAHIQYGWMDVFLYVCIHECIFCKFMCMCMYTGEYILGYYKEHINGKSIDTLYYVV